MINKLLNSKRANKKSAAYFDLDSTLFDVSPRSQKILQEFSLEKEFKNKFPEQSKKLEEIKVFPSDWGIEEPLSRAEIVGKADFFKSITLYWRKKFLVMSI